INGLRAWAVISVVFYHFNLRFFPGGFVGVDVFFVISGFLMTKIIITGFENNQFSFAKFFISRLIRIFPALFALTFVLAIIGWSWLPSLFYKNLSVHSLSAILFISNIKFWREAGYFDAESHEKWLLHTWSLSVEMQFYIILPIIIFILWKIKGYKSVIAGLILISFLSLILSYFASFKWPSAAFFLFPTRAWEMLAGGFAWILSRKTNIKWYYEIIGFALILCSLFLFNTALSWPGIAAIVPVLGSVLILLTNNQKSFLTNNFIAQHLGNWSYSIYLWHWPVVVFLSFGDYLNSTKYISFGIALSILLGATSFYLIESPTRSILNSKKNTTRAKYTFTLVVISAAFSLFGIFQNSPNRINADLEKIAMSSLDKNPNDKCLLSSGKRIDTEYCTFGNGDLKAIVLGDSHADAVINAVAISLHGKGSVLELTYAGCPTIFGAKREGHDCENFNKIAVDKMMEIDKNVPVIIINRFSMYELGTLKNENPVSMYQKPAVFFSKKYEKVSKESREEFSTEMVNTLCAISQSRKVFVTTPIPEMPVDVPRKLSHDLMFNRGLNSIHIKLEDYHHRNMDILDSLDVARKECGVEVLDVTQYLCDNDKCLANKGSEVYYFDDDHLSELGNKKLIPMFKSVLNK
ncbi:TPA: acyltransferase, partial [Klebsiella pneumoniae]|nr:acyltransferase [Klebsiella pneumoniae]